MYVYLAYTDIRGDKWEEVERISQFIMPYPLLLNLYKEWATLHSSYKGF